jgi:hypothetical protein
MQMDGCTYDASSDLLQTGARFECFDKMSFNDDLANAYLRNSNSLSTSTARSQWESKQ